MLIIYNKEDLKGFNKELERGFARFINTKEEINGKITLTGNPFVDTSLSVISHLTNKKIIDLTINTLIDLYRNMSYGQDLTSYNARLKSSFMCFTNNPLQQNSYREGEKLGVHYEKQEIIYRIYLTEFLLNIIEDSIFKKKNDSSTKVEVCSLCGLSTNFDFYRLESEIQSFLGKDEYKYGSGPTRGWVPLIGTIGSDAQALPAMSNTHTICPRCLFILQFLPLGSSILNGKLAAFQLNNPELVGAILSPIIDTNLEKLRSLSNEKKIEVYGKGKSDISIILQTLRSIKNYEFKDTPSGLSIWLFSNSGTGPEIELMKIPSGAIQWLNYAMKIPHYEKLIEFMITSEKKVIKNPNRHFLNSISGYSDYPMLYIKIKRKSQEDFVTPINFYYFYQHSIRGISLETLESSKKVVKKIKESIDDKKISRLLNENHRDLINLIYSKTINMINNNELTFDEVKTIFLVNIPFDRQTIQSVYKPYNTFNYLLMPEVDLEKEINIPHLEKFEKPVPNEDLTSLLSLISYFAYKLVKSEQKKAYYNNKGKDVFLNKLSRYNYVQIRFQFEKLARQDQKFDYQYFEDMMGDIRWEFFMFLLRAIIASDYKMVNNDLNEKSTIEYIFERSGLSKIVFNNFLEYIKLRISETGKNRVKRELSEDLKKISMNNLLNRLDNKKEINVDQIGWLNNDIKSDGAPNWFVLRFKLSIVLHRILDNL